MSNDILMCTFGFNEDTLCINRAGKLTPSQLQELEELTSGSIKATLILIPISVAMTLAMAYFVMTKDGKPLNPLEVQIFLYGLFACVGLALLWFIFNLKIWSKKKPYRVEGTAKHKISEIYDSISTTLLAPSNKQFIYSVKIGRKKFILQDEKEMQAFNEDKKYIVYYIPKTGYNCILSAELAG